MKKWISVLLTVVVFVPSVVFAQEVYTPSDQETFDLVQQQNLNRLQELFNAFGGVDRGDGFIDLEVRFSDIGSYEFSDDFQAALQLWIHQVPLLQGEGEGGRFGMFEGMPRAVVAEILLRLSRLMEGFSYDLSGTSAQRLADVPADAWFAEAMQTAVANGVFIPQDGKVRPEERVNWAELATIIRRFLGLELVYPEIWNDDAVTDLEWHDPEFFSLRSVGILQGFSLHPVDYPNKGDLALLLYFALAQLPDSGELLFSSPIVQCTFSGAMDLCYQRNIDADECEQLKELERDECWKRLATESRQLHFCLQISKEHEYLMAQCLRMPHFDGCPRIDNLDDRAWCYRQFRNVIDDSRYCDLEENGAVRDQCHLFYSFLEYESDDLEPPFCLAIQDQLIRDECFGRVGQWKDDSRYCEQVSDSFMKGECYQNIAHDTRDVALCFSIPEGEDRGPCFTAVAGSTGDPSHCEHIQDLVAKDECYVSTAILHEKPEYCSPIVTSSSADHCYREMAFLFRDTVYCEDVQDEQGKTECLGEIGEMLRAGVECNAKETSEETDDCFLEYARRTGDREYCVMAGHYDKCYELIDQLESSN